MHAGRIRSERVRIFDSQVSFRDLAEICLALRVVDYLRPGCCADGGCTRSSRAGRFQSNDNQTPCRVFR